MLIEAHLDLGLGAGQLVVVADGAPITFSLGEPRNEKYPGAWAIQAFDEGASTPRQRPWTRSEREYFRALVKRLRQESLRRLPQPYLISCRTAATPPSENVTGWRRGPTARERPPINWVAIEQEKSPAKRP